MFKPVTPKFVSAVFYLLDMRSLRNALARDDEARCESIVRKYAGTGLENGIVFSGYQLEACLRIGNGECVAESDRFFGNVVRELETKKISKADAIHIFEYFLKTYEHRFSGVSEYMSTDDRNPEAVRKDISWRFRIP